ncbi:hypothetical protein CMK14_08020 [Candidatus Poribacteria bacterium]|nr:hypothetical protein [Candidatus Poribacteria bacterium]
MAYHQANLVSVGQFSAIGLCFSDKHQHVHPSGRANILAAGSTPNQTLVLGSYQVLNQADFYQLL